MRFEFELLKQDGQNEDTEDDGFLDAMNASAESVWGDVDVLKDISIKRTSQ